MAGPDQVFSISSKPIDYPCLFVCNASQRVVRYKKINKSFISFLTSGSCLFNRLLWKSGTSCLKALCLHTVIFLTLSLWDSFLYKCLYICLDPVVPVKGSHYAAAHTDISDNDAPLMLWQKLRKSSHIRITSSCLRIFGSVAHVCAVQASSVLSC